MGGRGHAVDCRLCRGRTHGRPHLHGQRSCAGRLRLAFKLVDAGGQLTLAPAWPLPVWFRRLRHWWWAGWSFRVERRVSLGPGDPDGRAATTAFGARRLYVLDAVTGKPLWNSGLTITSPARARLAAGSGQVYLVTADNHLYAFGIPMEH